jgi:hypothetical protein
MSMRATLLALTILLVPTLSGANTSALTGTWNSAQDEQPLSTAFDESVWGKNATSVRTVQMSIGETGDAILSITRKVVDGRGRTVAASTSIEQASLVLGNVKSSNTVRSELETTVKHAERRYPDDPGGTWTIEGLQVEVATFNEKPGEIEVRVDFPDGRGSFWEILRRAPGKTPAKR